MSFPYIWVVIPSFNSLDITLNCLQDLSKQTFSNVVVVLSDSGSWDGTVDVVRKKYPHVVIVSGNPSWWWTKATNEGVKYVLRNAEADDYIMTLNNDVITPPNYLAEIINFAKQYPQSIIGSVIYDAADRNRLVECGSYIEWRTMKYHFLAPDDFDRAGFCEKLTFLCGKGVLYPSSVFRVHSLFAERSLPHYGADQDFVALCKRWGYTLRVQTNIPLYSLESITAAGAWEAKTFAEKLKLLFIRKSKLNLGVHMRIMLRHCPRRYWATSGILLTGRLLGHIFVKRGTQHGPARVRAL